MINYERWGEGGLNLWDLGARYRMGAHAQIFFGRRRFDLFSRNQRFQTAHAQLRRAIRTMARADRRFIFFVSPQAETRGEKSPRNSGWGEG